MFAHVDAEQITGHNLTEGFRGLIEAGTLPHTARRHNLPIDSNDEGGPFPEEGAAFDGVTDADLLDVVLLDHGSSKAAMVELCRRYSNHPDLLNPLASVLEKIKNGTPDTEPDHAPVRGNEPGVWRLADRLSPSDVGTLIESYQAGSTARLLAERYNVSTATVKRLLHEHGVRKRRPRAVA